MIIFVALMPNFLVACATIPQIENPHVFIPNASITETQNALIAQATTNGWSLEKQSTNEVVFDVQPDDTLGTLVMNANTARLIYIFTQNSEGTTVFGRTQLANVEYGRVVNSYQVTGSNNDMQIMLEKLGRIVLENKARDSMNK